MPLFFFTGLTAMTYPESKDAAGQPLGTVQPGDVRDLDEPLDHLWVPASGGEAKSRPRRKGSAETEPSGDGQDPGSQPAASTDTAGAPGSEEH